MVQEGEMAVKPAREEVRSHSRREYEIDEKDVPVAHSVCFNRDNGRFSFSILTRDKKSGRSLGVVMGHEAAHKLCLILHEEGFAPVPDGHEEEQ